MNINDMLGNEPVMQDRSPEGQIFAIEAEIKNLMQEYDVAVRSGDDQRARMIGDRVNNLDKIKIEMQEKTRPRQIDNIKSILNAGTLGMAPGKDMGGRPIRMDADTVRQNQKDMGDLSRFGMNMGGEASSQHMMPDGTPMPGSNHEEYEAMMMQQRQMMASGGTPFPDLTGDGQITQADILKGRGVYAEGGETIDDELEGMEMTEEQAMAEVGVAEKEMQMIQQLVAVVQQLIAEGLGEKDIVAFLKEQGLDDEDIDSLMQMVLQAQSGQAPEGIDQQLQGMM